jgi:hypothetical protein
VPSPACPIATASAADRLAADENGIRFVHVTWGFGDATRWDHRIERFAELTALVG